MILCILKGLSKCIKLYFFQNLGFISKFFFFFFFFTGPRSAVGNVSGNRCESDCRSRGREFDPGPVPYFRGD